MVLFGVALPLGLLLLTFVLIHCPFGIALFTWLCLLLIVIYFLISVILGIVLVGQSDVCPNLEAIVIFVAGNTSSIAPLLK